MLRALVWDVDGTLAETERDGHRVAFNMAFERLGLPWRWSVQHYGELLAVTGGRERLLHDMAGRVQAPTQPERREALARELHKLKNSFYAGLVAEGGIALRPGVQRLFDECAAAGWAMAIASTTSETNIDALLARALGPQWRQRFAAVVGAETAPLKKPDPMAYRLACEAMNLSPQQCLAIEDSRNGLAAAVTAGVPTLVTRSAYFSHQQFDQALAVCDALDSTAGLTLNPRLRRSGATGVRIELAALQMWHAQFLEATSVETPVGSRA